MRMSLPGCKRCRIPNYFCATRKRCTPSNFLVQTYAVLSLQIWGGLLLLCWYEFGCLDGGPYLQERKLRKGREWGLSSYFHACLSLSCRKINFVEEIYGTWDCCFLRWHLHIHRYQGLREVFQVVKFRKVKMHCQFSSERSQCSSKLRIHLSSIGGHSISTFPVNGEVPRCMHQRHSQRYSSVGLPSHM